MPVTSEPRKLTLPAVGLCAPVITLNRVVLPAPLGPMNPQICFSGTSKLTSFKAATPPKYFVRVFTSRIFTSSPEKPHQPAQESDQAVGFQQYNCNEHRAIQKKMDVGRMDHQFLFHNAKDDSSQHRPPHGANSANHGYQQDIDARLEGKYVTGINKGVIASVESSGKSCHCCRHGMDP